MDKKNALEIKDVKKIFRLPTEATTSLRRTLVNMTKGVKGYKEQLVLEDISFNVAKGDFFGIVGRNGSGKSTLLKIISQIYEPENGTIEIDGKLVSFIELGVGFNPELTGIENVYLNGALLGFTTEEIDAMYQDIVDFAELHEFMNQKLKNYSSGMQVRLAFSVAIKAQGDILVLDEVLAVGDEAFQRKCNDYFMERKKTGKTTILVTHDMGAVRKYCNRAVMIRDGHIVAIGDPEEVANKYTSANFEVSGVATTDEEANAYKNGCNEIIPSFELELLSKELLSPVDTLRFTIRYEVTKDIPSGVGFSMIDVSSGGAYSIIDDGCIIDEEFCAWATKAGVVEKTYELPMKNFRSRDFMIVGTVFTGKSGIKGDFQPIGFLGSDRGMRFFVRADGNVGPLLQDKGRFVE